MTVDKIVASGGVDLQATDRKATDRKAYILFQDADAASVEIEKQDIDAENNDDILDRLSEKAEPRVISTSRVAPQTVNSGSNHLTRKIFLAGLASPILVFCGCIVTGLVMFLLNFFLTGKFDFESVLGMIYGGTVYAMFAAVITIPATLLFGLPLSYLVWKLQALTTKVILMGATMTGAVCLVLLAGLLLPRIEPSFLMLCLAIGASGGFVNGYAFLRLMRR